MVRRQRRRALLGVLLAALLWPASARAQGSDELETEQQSVRQRQADLAAEIDLLRATDQEVVDALALMNANVASQQARVVDAGAASAAARAAAAAAEVAAVERQAEVEVLSAQVAQMALDLYMRPPLEDLIGATVSAEPDKAPLTFALARFRVEDTAAVLRELEAARDALADARDDAVTARDTAEATEAAEGMRLGELEAARAQQLAFAAQVSERIDRALSEAGQLAAYDEELSDEIIARQVALAAALAAAAVPVPVTVAPVAPVVAVSAPPPASTSQEPAAIAPDEPSSVPPPSSSPPTSPAVTPTSPPTTAPPRVIAITPVATTWVWGIEVATVIAGRLEQMLTAAAADGIVLEGSGYRNILDQIDIRKRHCGTTDYDVFDRPSFECSPPVARPGTSMHEQGLAVDFIIGDDLIRSTDSPAFVWLSAHAATYGFFNLPSEPWHWSINGR